MKDLEIVISDAYELRGDLGPGRIDEGVRRAVEETMTLLDRGEIRVAEPSDSGWLVHEWIKKAVLLYLVITETQIIDGGFAKYFDKVPTKFVDDDFETLSRRGVRIVPPAIVRRGAHVAPGVVMMPSYINLGAFVDRGTMVDTWATVGSCAQIGKNVHLSGGVGIGGVLEPLQARPTIIEDNCFIGARSEIVEGVVVEAGAVISMGVYIGQSTRIYNRETQEITYGRVPAGAVVVSGNLPSDDGRYSLYCAVIVKQVDEKTRAKVGINELLRSA